MSKSPKDGSISAMLQGVPFIRHFANLYSASMAISNKKNPESHLLEVVGDGLEYEQLVDLENSGKIFQERLLYLIKGLALEAVEFGARELFVGHPQEYRYEFFVDETRPFKDLSEDWTACHELSHMLLPFVSRKDRWLSEGLASYYQYLLLARSGTLSEKDAWQGFYDGIKRGENGTPRGTSSNTLAEATLQGRGQTMRVYWSGAALMFLADTQLRAASNNEQSLDSALKSLQSCCMDGSKLWRADELFKRLDGLTGTRVFSSLYKEHVHSISFPDLSGTWEALGIRHRFNRVSFNDAAPQADIRKAIVTP